MSTLNFSGFAGNEKVKTALSLAFDEGRFPHAVVLEGSAESGRNKLAGILAKAAVCQSGQEKPCGHCSGCIKAQAGSHPDIFSSTVMVTRVPSRSMPSVKFVPMLMSSRTRRPTRFMCCLVSKIWRRFPKMHC